MKNEYCTSGKLEIYGSEKKEGFLKGRFSAIIFVFAFIFLLSVFYFLLYHFLTFEGGVAGSFEHISVIALSTISVLPLVYISALLVNVAKSTDETLKKQSGLYELSLKEKQQVRKHEAINYLQHEIENVFLAYHDIATHISRLYIDHDDAVSELRAKLKEDELFVECNRQELSEAEQKKCTERLIYILNPVATEVVNILNVFIENIPASIDRALGLGLSSRLWANKRKTLLDIAEIALQSSKVRNGLNELVNNSVNNSVKSYEDLLVIAQKIVLPPSELLSSFDYDVITDLIDGFPTWQSAQTYSEEYFNNQLVSVEGKNKYSKEEQLENFRYIEPFRIMYERIIKGTMENRNLSNTKGSKILVEKNIEEIIKKKYSVIDSKLYFWFGTQVAKIIGFCINQNLSDRGDANAQVNLGRMYEFGYGVPKDYVKAVKCYEKAAEYHYARAQDALGDMHKNGFGVPKDYAKAVEWYQKAADQGYSYGQIGLGLMYEHGFGVLKDYTKAVEWYQKAADQDQKFIGYLGQIYENDEWELKNYAKAIEYYQKAADQGDAQAQIWLGHMYEKGRGVKLDKLKAIEWYEKAAELEDPAGLYDLGFMYLDDEQLSGGATKSVACYRKAAELGHALAQVTLGMMYECGHWSEGGAPKDEKIAAEWYRKAADQGVDDAQVYLGKMYEDGRGVPQQDYSKAMEWYQKAAVQGNVEAQDCLIKLNEKLETKK